jgi:hypothetical protein
MDGTEPAGDVTELLLAAEGGAPDAVSRGSDLFVAYGKWADRQRLSKQERLNAKDFGRRMAERFTRRHTNSGKVYHGVEVLKSSLSKEAEAEIQKELSGGA